MSPRHLTLFVLATLLVPHLVLASWSTLAEDDECLILRPALHFDAGIALAVALTEDGLALNQQSSSVQETYRGLFQSPVIAAPAVFDALHFSYRAKIPVATEVAFQVRAVHDGEVGRWHVVGREGEALFDAPATQFQYRVVLMTADPASSPLVDELVFVFELRSTDAPVDEPGTSAPPVVPTTAPPITERDGWGARPPQGTYAEQDVRHLIVHHTYAPDVAHYQGAASVRSIQKYHMDDKHWMDIGYHFLIGPDGIVYRGRPETAVGAHCIPNTAKVGISVIGNYDSDLFSTESRASLVTLLTYLAKKYGISSDRILGHQDFASTLCPGTGIYGVLPELRHDVDALLRH